MKLFNAVLFSAVVLSLTACGGGGGDDAPPPAAPAQPAVSLEEFSGVWKREDAVNGCSANFIYNNAYHHRLRDITLTDKGNGQLELAVAKLVYEDNQCAIERGVVTERFAMTAWPVVRAGRDNVFKADPLWVNSVSRSIGGGTITLTKLPDGSMTDLKGAKLIGDVRDGRLELAVSNMSLPLDSAGYPNDFQADNYWIR